MEVSNIRRNAILKKGYANKTDIQVFVPCGQRKANKVYEKIREKTLINGEEIGLFGIDPRYLCEELHITPEQIQEWAEEENIAKSNA